MFPTLSKRGSRGKSKSKTVLFLYILGINMRSVLVLDRLRFIQIASDSDLSSHFNFSNERVLRGSFHVNFVTCTRVWDIVHAKTDGLVYQHHLLLGFHIFKNLFNGRNSRISVSNDKKTFYGNNQESGSVHC